MKKSIVLTLFLIALSSQLFAQNEGTVWQYSAYPDLPFTIEKVDLEMTVDPEQPLLVGKGTYTLISRNPKLSRIVFNSAESQIESIFINGEQSDFAVSFDSLIITLADTLKTGEKAALTINWTTSSRYGINKDVYGNVWASLNPKSRRYWMPLPDHPEVTFMLNAAYTVPTELELVSHGTKVSDELSSVDLKTVEWNSTEDIPVSGLTFVLGNYESINARAGVKKVTLHANENALLPEAREELLDIAVSTLKSYEQKVSSEFPYRSLNVVVLPDHHWEEIHSGAGVIYLYQNLGSLATQLRRGIAGQWFGNYHRYLKAYDNRYEFLKVLMADSRNTGQLQNADNLQSIHRWNIWESGVQSINNEYMKEVMEESLADMIQHFKGVTEWENYADLWYDKTGYYWETLPQPEEFEERKEDAEPENEVTYNVEYVYDELNGSLTLVFEADEDPIETLVSVEATAYSFTDTTETEFTFTGAQDTVGVNLSTGIDYMTIRTPDHPDLILNESKPFMFWIGQLRDKKPENRIQAAKALQAYSDNPDLQLALRDVMTQEQNEEVRAAMLETLSTITKDATGTEETFIGYVNSESVSTQLSGLKALANYEGNESAAYTVRNKLIRTDTDTVFNTALRSYVQIAPVADVISLAERFQSSGEDDRKALKTLKTVIADDTTGSALQIADRYALGNYPYEIRKEALQLLINNNTNSDYWNESLNALKEDRDPRIRFIALDAVEYMESDQRNELLSSMLNEELDPRVIGKIRELQN
ncbi:hypothetical protein ACKGJO_02645 [Gracilimonas sp. Q87]|uniref:hypothetical protein n=1 Tax=Gracilimonas sp. Q87 TaxID=3384766 RepID=UPI003983E84E